MLKNLFSILTAVIAFSLITFVACKKCDDLPTPTVAVTSISSTTVKATWNKVEGADSYEVVLANESLASKANISTKEVTTNEATFDAITVKTAMVVKVTPRCKNGKLSTATGISSAFIPSTPCNLPAPATIKVSPLTATTARLNWESVSGAVGYQITVKNLTTQVVKTINTQAPTTILDDLQAGTKYEISVAAKCSDGSVSASRKGTPYEHFIIIDDTVVMLNAQTPYQSICNKNGGTTPIPLVSGATQSQSYTFTNSESTGAGTVTFDSYHVKVTTSMGQTDLKFICAKLNGGATQVQIYTKCKGQTNLPSKDNLYPDTFTGAGDIKFTFYAGRVDITNTSSLPATVYIEN